MGIPTFQLGFRFHPTDVELVGYYLKRKVMGKSFHLEAVAEIELYKFAPWDLPEKSLLHRGDLEWYFFCPQDKRYPSSARTKCATDIGYWKPTGNDKPIILSSRTIGKKKTLVFHLGKAPKSYRTDWVMYEYRLEETHLFDPGYSQDAYVLCKIFQKSGLGPKIGVQFGSPFNEMEWEDPAAEDVLSLPQLSCPSLTLLDGPAVSSNAVQQLHEASDGVDVSPNPNLYDVDGLWLTELAELLNVSPVEENGMKKLPDSGVFKAATSALTDESRGVYDGFGDLSAMMLRNRSYSEGMDNEYSLLPILSDLGDEQFLELNDFLDLGENEILKLIDPFVPHSPVHDSNYDHLNNGLDLICHHNDVTSTASVDCFAPSSSDITFEKKN